MAASYPLDVVDAARWSKTTPGMKDQRAHVRGFAVIAWPVKYDDTGVMTVMVNQDGVVYERDLGPDTEAKAAAINTFLSGRTGTRSTRPRREEHGSSSVHCTTARVMPGWQRN